MKTNQGFLFKRETYLKGGKEKWKEKKFWLLH